MNQFNRISQGSELADLLSKGQYSMSEAVAEIRRQHARIAELEYQLAVVQQPVVVPSTTNADEANAKYGEAYGVDWVYAAAQQGVQA